MNDGSDELKEGVFEAYDGFAGKLRTFSERASLRSDVHCARGCSACCVSGLSVCSLEAARLERALSKVSPEVRERVNAQAREEQREKCVFLLQDACAVYDARPMVCRSQGLPLAYAKGTIEPQRRSAEATDGRDLTWCPLNYQDEPPSAAEIVDAETLDRGVGTLNGAFASITGTGAEERRTLRDIALGGES